MGWELESHAQSYRSIVFLPPPGPFTPGWWWEPRFSPQSHPVSLALAAVLRSALLVTFLLLEPRSLAGSRLQISSPWYSSARLPDFRNMPCSLSQQSLLAAVLLCFLNQGCTEQRWCPCCNRLSNYTNKLDDLYLSYISERMNCLIFKPSKALQTPVAWKSI